MTLSPARILIAEDDPASRDVLERLLRGRGYQVQSASDGTAALAQLDGDDPPFDLVLLDVSMPGLSGFEVLEAVRRRLGPDRLPIILVTAFGESADVVEGLESGANDYVPKPVNPPVLLARIEAQLRVRRSAASAADAERYRTVLDAVGGAADQLSEPLAALERALTDGDAAAASAQVRELGERIERFRRLADQRDQPYSDGAGGFLAASLDQLDQDDA